MSATTDHPVAQHTPGPWSWFGNADSNTIYLATNHSGRRYVMRFNRWGMRGDQPVFQPGSLGMVPAADLLKFQVGDRCVTGVKEAKANTSVYRMDILDIDCADARLIAAAPELLEAARTMTALVDHLLTHPNDVLDEHQAEEFDRAHAAIAKAEGR